MATSEKTILRNIRGSELPAEWARQANIDKAQTVNITIDPQPQRKRKKTSYEELMRLVERFRQRVDTTKFLSDDDLYDEHGLPK